jgi:hypothetical protein
MSLIKIVAGDVLENSEHMSKIIHNEDKNTLEPTQFQVVRRVVYNTMETLGIPLDINLNQSLSVFTERRLKDIAIQQSLSEDWKNMIHVQVDHLMTKETTTLNESFLLRHSLELYEHILLVLSQNINDSHQVLYKNIQGILEDFYYFIKKITNISHLKTHPLYPLASQHIPEIHNHLHYTRQVVYSIFDLMKQSPDYSLPVFQDIALLKVES